MKVECIGRVSCPSEINLLQEQNRSTLPNKTVSVQAVLDSHTTKNQRFSFFARNATCTFVAVVLRVHTKNVCCAVFVQKRPFLCACVVRIECEEDTTLSILAEILLVNVHLLLRVEKERFSSKKLIYKISHYYYKPSNLPSITEYFISLQTLGCNEQN